MKKFLQGILLISLIISLISCKERDDHLGENYLDGQLEVCYDTIEDIKIWSEPYDDTVLIKTGVTTSLIGNYYDEDFGTHSALTVLSFLPSSNSADVQEYVAVDSLVLQLPFTKIFYGFDTTNYQTIRVYRATNDISNINETPLSLYQNNGLEQYYNPNDPIGETTFRPKIDTTKHSYLRIRLEDDIAAEMFNNFNVILNDTACLDLFKGFIIKAERTNGNGAIMSFNNNKLDAYLRLYFHKEGDTISSYFDYLSKNSEGLQPNQYNFFEHDYLNSLAYDFIFDTIGDPGEDDSLAFAQAMRGINLKIKVNMESFNGFSNNLINQNIVINRAIIQLHTTHRLAEVGDTVLEYPPPQSFAIREITDNNNFDHLIDYYLSSINTSAPVSYNNNDKLYTILLNGLTHKKIVEQNLEYTLWLSPLNITTSANRAVFYGSGALDETKKPKLIIVYTKSK